MKFLIITTSLYPPPSPHDSEIPDGINHNMTPGQPPRPAKFKQRYLISNPLSQISPHLIYFGLFVSDQSKFDRGQQLPPPSPSSYNLPANFDRLESYEIG